MPEQGELQGIAAPSKGREPTGGYHKKYPIPKFPEFGQQRFEDMGQTHEAVIPFGSPVMLPDGKLGRVLEDVRLTPELFQMIEDRGLKKTTRRVGGKNVSLITVEVPRAHILFAADLPSAFRFYLTDEQYRKRIRRREGEIQADTRYIATKDPAQFDPAGASKGVMHLLVHPAFAQQVRRPTQAPR